MEIEKNVEFFARANPSTEPGIDTTTAIRCDGRSDQSFFAGFGGIEITDLKKAICYVWRGLCEKKAIFIPGF